ncbi:MAG: protein translocase subunit SecF [Spirochaetes bacterium]|nr:protein translocase subunit SecF [Spirochaetota bacterium]
MRTNFNFIKLKNIAFVISIVVILIGGWLIFGPKDVNLGIFTAKGFKLGIDFQGGLIHQLKIYDGFEINRLRNLVSQAGLGNEVQEVTVSENRRIKNESSFLIKTIITAEEQEYISENNLTPSKFLEDKINKLYGLIIEEVGRDKVTLEGADYERAISIYGKEGISGTIDYLSTDTSIVVNNVTKESESIISPSYSEGLRLQALLFVLFLLLIMLVYVSFRFRFDSALGAVAALFHDTLILLGVITLAQVELDWSVVAAILTIIGYSINDTIVVFDRIRENRGILEDRLPIEIFNISINQTLSRTIITSLTTLLVVGALFVLGGPKIKGFAFTLLVGIFIGTYSSIFIASPIVYLWDKNFSRNKKKYKKMELKQEEKKQKEVATEQNEEATTEEAESTSEEIQLSRQKLKKLTGGKKKR